MSNASDGKGAYTHATSLDNLKVILSNGGKIKALRHIARDTPEAELSVEPLPLPWRMNMKASDAYSRMKGIKNTDDVFLARDGYVPNYGDVVVVKQMSDRAVTPGARLNTIPNEFTTRRALSLKNNATVYVPDDQLAELKKEYRGIRFRPKSEFKLHTYGLKDRFVAFKDKLKQRLGFGKEASDSAYKRKYGRNARLVGSEALGINVPGKSDVDVFVPYKRESAFRKAIARMQERHPGLQLNRASLKRDDKKTFSGSVNGQDVDVVLAYGPRAERFRQAFEEAARKLTPEKRREIVETKARLKKAWFFPQWRYKRYKNQVAEELGLKQAYF